MKQPTNWPLVAASLAIVPISIITNAALVMLMWRWFVVPLGVHAVSLSHAFGLAVIANALTNHNEVKPPKEDLAELTARAYAALVGRVVGGLSLACIAHHFMVTP